MAATLRIRVGTSVDSLVVCNPNDEARPVRILSEHFDGYFLIRIKNFQGVVPEGEPRIPNCSYFEGRRRLMSVQFQGSFTQPWTANDLVWSNDWEQPLNVPKVMSLFTKFMSVTDPGSYSDLKIDRPYMRSYVVTAMCTLSAWSPVSEDPMNEPFRVNITEDASSLYPTANGPRATSRANSLASVSSTTSNLVSVSLSDSAAKPGRRIVPPRGASLAASAAAAAEPEEPARDWKLIEKAKKGGEEGVAARRKFFASEVNRREAIFHPSQVYGFEVFNPYFDPNSFKTKIPGGVTIDMRRMMRGQPMRTRLMTSDGRTVFLVVELSQESDGDLDDDTDD
ncbi:hypothetical protein DFJ73DRAFT_819205 [Zopfochytrium polystomum]|nr:hypothetical protein DFJ73DRAFT_819205 [Zopfochytrium polystomum]